MARLLITIDGPAASGKSTVARLLAERLGAAYLDTGAMYRAVTLAAIQAGIDLNNQHKILDLLDRTNLEFEPSSECMKVTLNGCDVTDQIRDPRVTANAHYIANAPLLRDRLVKMQRDFAKKYDSLVTEGRDQGTVAFPDADFKFFLTADTDERTRRRLRELAHKTMVTFEQLKQEIEQRDHSDRSRSQGPLRPADDAIIIDTTNMSIEQVVQELMRYILASNTNNSA